VAAHHSFSTLDARFGREAFTTFTGDLESSRLRGGLYAYARDTSMDRPRCWGRAC
jgi:hypothetical protein